MRSQTLNQLQSICPPGSGGRSRWGRLSEDRSVDVAAVEKWKTPIKPARGLRGAYVGAIGSSESTEGRITAIGLEICHGIRDAEVDGAARRSGRRFAQIN